MLELIINFIIGLPPTKIKTGELTNIILVIVNKYIKFSEYFAVTIIIIAVKLADLFLKQWLLFSILRGIILNKSTIFNSIF